MRGPRARVAATVLVALVLHGVLLTARPAAADDLAAVYLPAPERPRVTMIGDSSLAGVRWLAEYGSMRGAYDVVLDAESCRRTDYEGCRGREGYAPISALDELRAHAGTLGSFVVAMVGYNDSAPMFAEAIDRFMAEAMRQGVYTVFWVTFRVSVSYRSPLDWSNDGTFRIHNQTLADRVQRYGGRLQLIDWNAYSANHLEWVHEDGVHLTPVGAPVLMSFIRSELDRFRGTPTEPPTLLGTTAEPVPGTPRPPGVIVPVAPTRILDTRAGSVVGPDRSRIVPVAGLAGVPANAVGVVVNLTATEARAAGFATLWPAGEARPMVSSINVVPGDTRANLAVVALGAGGALELYSLSAAHFALDVTAYIAAAPAATAAGRYVATTPARLYDSRSAGPALTAGSVVRVPVPGVTAGGGALVTVTVTESAAGGFVTVWSGEGPMPLASSVNALRGGIRSNTALVSPAADGTITLFTSGPTHLVVDLAGVVTAPTDPPSTSGRLVVVSPRRFADSRMSAKAVGPGRSQVQVAGRGGVPVEATAVLANATLVDGVLPGWLTVWGGGPWPGTSASNVEAADQVVAATHVSALDAGRVSLASNATTDVVYDVSGWFTP